MLDNFSASGSRVHTPCGPRKSGMPDSVEIPAPVRITTRLAAATQPRTVSIIASGCTICPSLRSWPHRGRLDLHPARAPHQVKLEIDQFGCTKIVRLRTRADEAIAQPPLERAQALPLEAVDRVTGGVRLRNDVAGKAFVPVVVVALGA